MPNGVRARAEAVPTRHKDGFRRSVAGWSTDITIVRLGREDPQPYAVRGDRALLTAVIRTVHTQRPRAGRLSLAGGPHPGRGIPSQTHLHETDQKSPTSQPCGEPAMISKLRAFGAFWYDFIIGDDRSEEHTSELQSRPSLVCR